MPKTKRKTARKSQGRPTGSKNRAPRARRQLTPVQKLREHILIELGVDKKDIAAAIGTTHQTVSNVFYDEHRSIWEVSIVNYLRSRYQAADQTSVANIDGYFHWFDFSSDPGGCPIRLDTMGWPKRVIEVEAGTQCNAYREYHGVDRQCLLPMGHSGKHKSVSSASDVEWQ